ncbi:hypothetical protein [Enemella sp. A6]|uniref:hypothetical protein n=1 Tax=Enemella sp. A6 TaxID=3440152 RepID=UPI003EB994E7
MRSRRITSEHWTPLRLLAAVLIVAVAVMLHALTPGPAGLRANHTVSAFASASSGSISVREGSITVTRSATFAGTECPEDGVFLVVTATYRFTRAGNTLRRGLEIGGTRYAPSACQNDLANAVAVPGEEYTIDTVFVIDEDTWARVRGSRVALRVGYIDPWYENLGPRAVLRLAVPVEMSESVEAQARR